jgi:hypothetical protein
MLFQLQIYKFCTDKRRKVVFLYENKLQYGFVIVNIFCGIENIVYLCSVKLIK